MKQLSLDQQSALNIVGSLLVVVINVVINFFLSPFIVEHLGVEANGYITLANNFISYIALVTMALNSMAGRFILIDYRRGNLQSANEYYSSVLFGDWLLAAVFFLPMVFFVVYIDEIINVPVEFVGDTRILFGLVFLNYVFNLCLPQWQTAPYCTNNLYLRSLKSAISSVIRAIAIFLLFSLFSPHSYYVAIAAIFMGMTSITLDYIFYMKLMPELQWKVSLFRWAKVKELVSSGIWNTVNQCGNLLLEGLDILIANIFINPVASGVLALSKILPNMIIQITGTVATTYGPRLTYLYTDGKMEEMAHEVKNDVMVVSVLANIPIGVFVAFSLPFFNLWVPSQDAVELTILSCISLLGVAFSGISLCFMNLFGVVNKLKFNSLVVIGSGLVNITCVLLLLKYTNLGIFAVVAASSVVSIIRIFSFTIPYSASLIKYSWVEFTGYLIKGFSNVIVPLGIGLVISAVVDVDTWLKLVLCVGITIVLALFLDCYLVLNKHQRAYVLNKLHIVR